MTLGTFAATVFPVITLALGHFMASRLDLRKDVRALERERVARNEQRRHRILERRAEFQRAVLIELQDVASDLSRATGAIFFLYTMKHRRDGEEWAKTPLPEDLSERHFHLHRRLNLLIARLTAGATQEKAKHFSDLSFRTIAASSTVAAEAALNGAGEAFVQLNDEVGRSLRRLDALEDEFGA